MVWIPIVHCLCNYGLHFVRLWFVLSSSAKQLKPLDKWSGGQSTILLAENVFILHLWFSLIKGNWVKLHLNGSTPCWSALEQVPLQLQTWCFLAERFPECCIFELEKPPQLLLWKCSTGFRFYDSRVELGLWCFHRNRGYCRCCRRYDQTVIPTHLPARRRTLPSRLQIWHTCRQAAPTVRKTLPEQCRYFSAVLTGLFFFIKSYLCWIWKISLVPP